MGFLLGEKLVWVQVILVYRSQCTVIGRGAAIISTTLFAFLDVLSHLRDSQLIEVFIACVSRCLFRLSKYDLVMGEMPDFKQLIDHSHHRQIIQLLKHLMATKHLLEDQLILLLQVPPHFFEVIRTKHCNLCVHLA